MSELKGFKLELLNDLGNQSTIETLKESKSILVEFIQHLRNSYKQSSNDLQPHIYGISLDTFLKEINKLLPEKRLLVFVIFNKLEKNFFNSNLTSLLVDAGSEATLITKDDLDNALMQNAILEDYLSDESIILMSYVVEDRMQEYRLRQSWNKQSEASRFDAIFTNVILVLGVVASIIYLFGENVCHAIFSSL